MRYRVRSEGGELRVSDYAELHSLYRCGFIADEDEIRKEDSDRWVKAGAIADLRLVKPRPWLQANQFAWLAVAIAVGSLILVLLMGRSCAGH